MGLSQAAVLAIADEVAERLASETITVTANHPYFMEDGSWRGAGELKPGDRIQGVKGVLTVSRVTADATPDLSSPRS
jgi:hypothetical protein